jgi:hypothetical protein
MTKKKPTKKSNKAPKGAKKLSKKSSARPGGGITALVNRSKREPSTGDLKSEVRSKHGLAPGFNGVIKSNGAVMHIAVDAKGREKIFSCYIPDSDL